MSEEVTSVLGQIAETLSGNQEVSEEVVTEEVSENVEAQGDETSEELEASSESVTEELSEESSEGTIEVQAETEDELVEELEQAEEDGATQEELTDMVRQYTLKVNNKEYVKELDLNDEDAVKRELQMALAGRQAMQQNSELKKAYNTDLDRLRENPWQVLEELGLNPIEMAAQRIEDHLAEKAKSPEQIEQEQRAKEYADMKSEIEALKAEKIEEERKVEMAHAEKEIESDIITALDGDLDLEASPEVINMVVDNMLFAMNNGFKDVTAKDVLPTVKKDIQKKYRSYAKSMKSTAALKSLLGDDVQEQLREERVQKAKKQVNNVSNIKNTSIKTKKEETPVKKRSLRDFMGGR